MYFFYNVFYFVVSEDMIYKLLRKMHRSSTPKVVYGKPLDLIGYLLEWNLKSKKLSFF